MLGGLLALNPGNLRGLILADRNGPAALLLLAFGFVVTFGSVAMGTAIMALGKDKTDRPRGGKRQLTLVTPPASPPSAPWACDRSRSGSTRA